jgi:hypothetical protein
MHDQTAIKTEGIEELLRRHNDVHAKVDAGYQGLAKAFPGPGPCTATQAGQGRATRGTGRLAAGAQAAVV